MFHNPYRLFNIISLLFIIVLLALLHQKSAQIKTWIKITSDWRDIARNFEDTTYKFERECKRAQAICNECISQRDWIVREYNNCMTNNVNRK